MLRWAFLALPFQMRQRRRSTSSTITAFAATRAGCSVDRALAICFRCCSRMAMWNQSRIGGSATPASARMRRSPGQPSVKAVNAVSSVRPTASRFRRISTSMSVSALATAPKTWRPPDSVSTLPTRTSRCRSPSSQLTDEGRIQGDHDRRGRRSRLGRGTIPKRLAGPQERGGARSQGPFRRRPGTFAPAQSAAVTVGHQGGEMRLKLVQLRCRSAMRWPVDARPRSRHTRHSEIEEVVS